MTTYKNLKVLYNDDIYAYIDLNRKEILDYLSEYDLDHTPDNIEDAATLFINSDYEYFNELVKNFDKKSKYDSILVIADFGLWYGRRQGYKHFKTLEAAIHSDILYDVNIFYFENNKNTLAIDSSHHDGNNRYKFYKIINGKKYAIRFNEFNNY